MQGYLKVTVVGNDKVEDREFHISRLINGGYSGRDAEIVQKHIDELKEMGITAPERFPCFFPKNPELITTRETQTALDENCSGEAEFVMIFADGEIYIGCGSDVFDYKVEALDAPKSKHLYPNHISSEVWKYSELREHWDMLELRSWHGENRTRLYQEGRVSEFLSVEAFEEKLRALLKEPDLNGTVLFSGTLAALIPGMPFTDCFEVEMTDPVLKRKIGCKYQLEKIDWFHE